MSCGIRIRSTTKNQAINDTAELSQCIHNNGTQVLEIQIDFRQYSNSLF